MMKLSENLIVVVPLPSLQEEFARVVARMEDSRFEYSWFHSWMVVC
jgi:hypothetical protein